MNVVPNQRVRHDLFDLALTFCELPRPVIAGTVLKEHFAPHGKALIDAGALLPAASRTSIFRNEQEIAVSWDAVRNAPAYLDRCGRWRTIPESELRQYRFRPEWILPFLAFQFSIPVAIKPHPLLADIAWELGRTSLGRQKITVLFARRLGHERHYTDLCCLLRQQRGCEDIIVLTSSRIENGRISQGDRHAFATLHDCQDINSGFFRINKGVIASLLDIPVTAEGFSPGFRSGCFNGVEYTFTKTQAAILECLFNAGKAVHKDELLAQADSAQKKIIDVFRGRQGVHPAYGVIIQGDDEGFYRLVI